MGSNPVWTLFFFFFLHGCGFESRRWTPFFYMVVGSNPVVGLIFYMVVGSNPVVGLIFYMVVGSNPVVGLIFRAGGRGFESRRWTFY